MKGRQKDEVRRKNGEGGASFVAWLRRGKPGAVFFDIERKV
jgi:hypothetical protein